MQDQDRIRYAVLVAVDWADKEHEAVVLETGQRRRRRLKVGHTPAQLGDFVELLREACGPDGRAALAVELKSGPLINFLSAFEFVDIHPIKTSTLAHFRRAFYPSGAKSDPLDADLALQILEKHPDQLEGPLRPDRPQARLMAELTRSRRGFVDEATRQSQRLRACLKLYYPAALEILGESLRSPMGCAFLRRWPTLERLQRARPGTLERFLRESGCRSRERLETCARLARRARPLTRDEAILQGQSLRALSLVSLIEPLLRAVAEYDRRIEELFAACEDAFIYRSLPGAGKALAPRLLAAMGCQRQRFASADSLARYNGCAPVTEGSGQARRAHWRWSAPVFVRQSFVEFASWSIHYSAWAKAYDQLLRERGCQANTRLRKLALKWSRILYRCWQSREAYDEARYVESLKRKASPVWTKMQQMQAS